MKKKEAMEKENLEQDERELKKQQKKKKARGVVCGFFWTLFVLCTGILIGMHWKVILKKIKGEELPEDCGCPVHRAKLSDSLKSAGDLVAGKELLKSAGDFVAGNELLKSAGDFIAGKELLKTAGEFIDKQKFLKEALENAELKSIKDLKDIRNLLKQIGK